MATMVFPWPLSCMPALSRKNWATRKALECFDTDESKLTSPCHPCIHEVFLDWTLVDIIGERSKDAIWKIWGNQWQQWRGMAATTNVLPFWQHETLLRQNIIGKSGPFTLHLTIFMLNFRGVRLSNKEGQCQWWASWAHERRTLLQAWPKINR